jgi:hypothetical protein
MGLYKTAVLASSPYLYLPMEENSGTALVDAGGNSRNGTLTGSYSYNASKLTQDSERSIQFTGGNGYVSDTHFNYYTDATFEFVVNVDSWSSGNTNYGLFGQGNNFYANVYWNGSTAYLQTRMSYQTTMQSFAATPIKIGVPVHVIVGFKLYNINGYTGYGYTKVWINGDISYAYEGANRSLWGYYGNCAISYDYNWYPLRSKFGHFAYYRRLITETEAADHYNAFKNTYGASGGADITVSNTVSVTSSATLTSTDVATDVSIVPSADIALPVEVATDFTVVPSAELGQGVTVDLSQRVNIDTITPQVRVTPVTPPVIINPPSGMPSVPVDPSKRKAPVIRTISETYPYPTVVDGRPV